MLQLGFMIKAINKNFFLFFIAIQVFLALFEIHRKSKIIKLYYNNQKLEKYRAELLNQKTVLNQNISAEKNLVQIKQFAQDRLKMKPIALNKLKYVQNSNIL